MQIVLIVAVVKVAEVVWDATLRKIVSVSAVASLVAVFLCFRLS